MTVSIQTTPGDALAGLSCRVVATATVGNFVRLWCTDAPSDSRLKRQLEESGASRVVFNAGVDSGKQFEFAPDRGGLYRLQAEEIRLGATEYGGGYQGDPNADQSETVLGAVNITLPVATPLTSKLGAGQDTAELLTYIKNAIVIQTRQDIHGVASPTIRNPSSSKALVAVESAGVRNALAALANASAATLLGNLTTVFNDLRAKYTAHASSGAIHFSADTVNTIPATFSGPASEAALVAAFRKLRDALDFHLRNDDRSATPSGSGTGSFHSSLDGVSSLVAPPPADIAGCVLTAADCHRAYERHRANNSIHESPDVANVAAQLPTLLALHSEFFAVIATTSPMTPNNEHPGVTVLVNGAGFQRA